MIAPGEVRGGDTVPLQIAPVFIAGRDVHLPVGATFEGIFNECAWVDPKGNVVESRGCIVNWGVFRFGGSRIEIDWASGEILSEYVIGNDEAVAVAIRRQLKPTE